MIILICNALAYIILFYISFVYAKRHVTIYNISVLWYALIAVLGVVTVTNGTYQEIYHINNNWEAKPYIYGFISTLLLLFPIYKFNKSQGTIEDVGLLNYKKIKIAVTILLVLFVLYGQVFVLLFFKNIGHSLLDLYTTAHEEGNALTNYSKFDGRIIAVVYPIYFSLYWFVIVISLLFLNKRNGRDRKFWIAAIVITAIPDLANFAMRAARGEMAYLCLKYILVLIFLWPYLNTNLKKKIKIVSLACGGLLLFFSILISISRFTENASSSQTASSSIIRYFGEPFPNLANVYWNHVYNHPMGLRLFPFLVDGTVDAGDSMMEQQDFWQWYTGVPMLYFKTLYGDLYIEFGEYGGLAAVVIISSIFFFCFKNRKMKYSLLPFWSVYLEIVSTSPLFFGFRGTGKFKCFVFAIIAYFFINAFLYNKNEKYT